VLVALLEVVVPTLAIDGDCDPPHPDASKQRLARTPANNERHVLEPDMRFELKQPSLKRP
jgi:hypothetical protein